MTPVPSDLLRLALPKGRIQGGVLTLLSDAGLEVSVEPRGYRAQLSLPDSDVKLLKPQNIVEMLVTGTRDLGFAGADWVAELDADVVEVLDTELDPVEVVVAGPRELRPEIRQALNREKVGNDPQPVVIASEYERLTRRWIERRELDARFVRSFGATEVFPPEDADLIVDNTATGSTLRANGLEILDTVVRSSTRLYASRRALEDSTKRDRIERLRVLLQSVLDARRRVMIELNVSSESLDGVVETLPCMREATVSTLHGQSGFAVRAAVPRRDLPELIPNLKDRGGTDLVVTELSQIVS